jgi:fumarate reductase subunit D
MKSKIDERNRRHASYWAFWVHRVSGVALALFLPVHFTLLAQALQGAAGLDRALIWTQNPLIKIAEWGLVSLLALHLSGGIRILLIEFAPWRGLRGAWVAGAFGFALVTGMAFALALIG